MNKLFFYLIMTACIAACNTNSAQNNHTLDVTEYKKQIESKNNIQLIDVRTPEEYKTGYLKNAVNIDYNANDFEEKIKNLDKNKTTYVYCLSGGRSENATALMKQKGFKEVYNMKGGMLVWKKNNFPLVTPNTASVTTKPEMTRAQFDSLCNSKIPVLFDFMAKWCGPCKELKPIIEGLEKEYEGQFKLVAIDIDENKTLAKELKIYSIPFIMIYKAGKHQMNIDGLTNKENLIEALQLKKGK